MATRHGATNERLDRMTYVINHTTLKWETELTKRANAIHPIPIAKNTSDRAKAVGQELAEAATLSTESLANCREYEARSHAHDLEFSTLQGLTIRAKQSAQRIAPYRIEGGMQEADLEDIAQNAFLAAWEQQSDTLKELQACTDTGAVPINHTGDYSTAHPALKFEWLVRSIAKGQARNLIRKRTLERRLFLPIMEAKEVQAEIKEAIDLNLDALSKEDRQLVKQRHYSGITVRELASIHSCTVEAIRWRLDRIKHTLEAALSDWKVTPTDAVPPLDRTSALVDRLLARRTNKRRKR